MTFDQIIQNLRKKVYHPVYLLTGEPYFIDTISDYIEMNVLDEAEKEFNLSILYGQDIIANTLINTAKRYPMMANYQVVIVREAQMMKDFDELAPYIERPLKSTLLVLCYKYKTIDKRKKLYKSVDKAGAVLETKPLYDSQIPNWIISYLKEKGYEIHPQASLLLAQNIGNDLSRIANELQKLFLNIPPTSTINADHIEKYIGISKEFNTFELQKALAILNAYKANQIVNYFNSNSKSNPLVLTLGTLFSFFSKLVTFHHIKDRSKNNVASVLKINPYFVQEYEQSARKYNREKTGRIISDIRECDARSKGIQNGSASEGELLRELVYKILH